MLELAPGLVEQPVRGIDRAGGRVGEGTLRRLAEITAVRKAEGIVRQFPCLRQAAQLDRNQGQAAGAHRAREGDGRLAEACLLERSRRSLRLTGRVQAEADLPPAKGFP